MGWITDQINSVVDEGADAAQDAAEDAATAIGETAGNPEQIDELRQQYQSVDGDSPGDHLKRLNLSTRAGMDILLDNQNGSVQEGLKEAMKTPTEVATGREISDKELANEFQRDTEAVSQDIANRIEGSHLDNPVTWKLGEGADMLFGDPANHALTMATGINAKTGSSEDNVNFVEGAEVALSAADVAPAAKLGVHSAKAVSNMGLLSASDEIAQTGSRFIDDILKGGTKASDEIAQTGATASSTAPVSLTDETTELLSTRTGQSPSFIRRSIMGGDEAASLASKTDEAANIAEDAGSSVPSSFIRRSMSTAASAGDEAANVAKKTWDDMGIFGKTAIGGTTAALGGGAVLDAAGFWNDKDSAQDESPDPKTPDDGESTTYMRKVDTLGERSLLFQIRNGSKTDYNVKGYAVMLAVSSGTIYVLTADGGYTESAVTTSDIKTGEVFEPRFGTKTGARSAFKTFKEQSKNDDGNGDGTSTEDSVQWGKWSHIRGLPYNWVLFGRGAKNADKTQFVVSGIYQTDSGRTERYLQSDGSVGDKPDIYETTKQVQKALDNFANKLNAGEEDRPIDSKPDSSVVRKDASEAAKKQRQGTLSGVLNNDKTAVVVLLVIAIIIYASWGDA